MNEITSLGSVLPYSQLHTVLEVTGILYMQNMLQRSSCLANNNKLNNTTKLMPDISD